MEQSKLDEILSEMDKMLGGVRDPSPVNEVDRARYAVDVLEGQARRIRQEVIAPSSEWRDET